VEIKGDKIQADLQLSWSFRTAFKNHDNPYITDEFYVDIKGERVEEVVMSILGKKWRH
jgi:hypothetical protein